MFLHEICPETKERREHVFFLLFEWYAMKEWNVCVLPVETYV